VLGALACYVEEVSADSGQFAEPSSGKTWVSSVNGRRLSRVREGEGPSASGYSAGWLATRHASVGG
jgi:hypothetical protein